MAQAYRTPWGRPITFDRTTPIPPEAYAVAEELWHVCMPGYTHPAEDSVDAALYLIEALCVVEHNDDRAFGSERITAELRGFLEGAGVVRCDVEAHHRGMV